MTQPCWQVIKVIVYFNQIVFCKFFYRCSNPKVYYTLKLVMVHVSGHWSVWGARVRAKGTFHSHCQLKDFVCRSLNLF